MRLIAAAGLAAVLAGCASAPGPSQQTVAAVGTAADQQAFSGLWRGAIDAVDPRFSGPLEFRLEPGHVLFPNATETPMRIQWVRFTEGKMTGATNTWYDPVRKTDVYRTFEATITDGVMHGIVRDKIAGEWSQVATFTATRAGD